MGLARFHLLWLICALVDFSAASACLGAWRNGCISSFVAFREATKFEKNTGKVQTYIKHKRKLIF
jgi:hypothetical protein